MYAHEQLHPGQLVISNTETLCHQGPEWEVLIAFTFAGTKSRVSGYGSSEQGAAIRAIHALGDLLAETKVDA